jgi:Acyl-protein synthetase, LuxE
MEEAAVARAGDERVERISAWIREAGRAPAGQPQGDGFEALALDAFEFQYQRIAAYRRLCDGRGIDPGAIGGWREIPAVPAVAFKSLELATGPARETFRSSGTTAERRSVHHHPYPELYREVIDATFPPAVLPGLFPAGSAGRPSILSLIPSREQLPDSSLSFLASHVLAHYGAETSLTAIGPAGVPAKLVRSWLGARQREGRPVVLLATALALAALLDVVDRLDLRFRLPAGSRLFETGGFKGRRRETERGELLARAADRLGLPPGHVVREYGMTELTSHFYTGALADGDPELFLEPPWTRVRILDPLTLEEAAPGATGLIAVFDLANVGSAVHLLTEDLGVAEAGGFRLVGRASGAELRGCSLTAEELTG